MRISAYYSSRRVNESLANLTCGWDIIELEDAVNMVKSGITLLWVLKGLYESRKIYKYPVECVEKPEGIYRVKLQDALGNISYMELKGESK